MTDYLPYITRDGDRWDLVAWRMYGDANRQFEIIEANPELAIAPVLPAGVSLRIPVLADEPPVPTLLPPWKRS